MTKWTILATGLLTLAAMTSPAQAGPHHAEAIVEDWYHRYLGRCADPCGLKLWSGELRRSGSPDHTLAGILGSQEYYNRHGCCPTGYIKGLFRDHLGRCATPGEVRDWLCELHRCGGNDRLAVKFLRATRAELVRAHFRR